ncbi:MAG: endonuclease [candidate division KSB1 bacterium]|nr:endonuclease [candidate division KSB1 bacterium]
MASTQNRYVQIIEQIFLKYYKEGTTEVPFAREDFSTVARKLKIKLPKNLGDILYSFRYRIDLPESIRAKAPAGQEWVIRPRGRARYAFVATRLTMITPSEIMAETKIPDATPGVIMKYALSDEQALLAKLRYNRLIDIFTGVTCYSLQSHLRTTVPAMGQVETDEIYIGLDKRGAHYVFPIQAKGGNDKLGVVQIEQDFAICAEKFPLLICRPIAAQFMKDDVIALFEFEQTENEIALSSEKHYRLVAPDEMTAADLKNYQKRSE